MKMKKDSGGMRSATMPKEKFERPQKQADGVDEKYGTEFGNAESYDKMNEGLVNYARKHKMKYE